MKLTSSVVVAVVCCTAQQVAASTAHVYTYEPHRQPSTPSILSPVEARLVLAQRAGVEDYHEADLLKHDVLDAVNTYGARTPLFTSVETEAKKAFVLFEGTQDVDARRSSLHPYHAFTISPAPSAEHSRELFVDLATQKHQAELAGLFEDERLSAIRGCNSPPENADHLFCIAESEKEFENIVEELTSSNLWSVTALAASPPSVLDSVFGSSDNETWGTYEMPSMQSSLHKRARPQKEAPLELSPSSAPIHPFTSPISVLASNSTSALRGILPACFPSLSACQTTTRNCTGHGVCTKKYTDIAADSKSPFKDCYACQCSATVSEDSEGRTRTTGWGGPACQKKDVSSAFWLIALFVVAMMFLIGFAVGEVWGMGDQELPSVIGAGVSGPAKR